MAFGVTWQLPDNRGPQLGSPIEKFRKTILLNPCRLLVQGASLNFRKLPSSLPLNPKQASSTPPPRKGEDSQELSGDGQAMRIV